MAPPGASPAAAPRGPPPPGSRRSPAPGRRRSRPGSPPRASPSRCPSPPAGAGCPGPPPPRRRPRPAGPHLGRRAHRRHDPDEGGGAEAGDARLLEARHIGRHRQPPGRAGGEDAHHAFAVQRQGGGDLRHPGLDVAGDQVRRHRSAAAIGHVLQGRPGRRVEALDRQVRGAAGARRSGADAAGRRLSQGDQLGQRPRRHAAVHRQHVRRADEQPDRGEVPRRVVAEIGLDHRVDRQRPVRAEEASHSHPAWPGRRRSRRRCRRHRRGSPPPPAGRAFPRSWAPSPAPRCRNCRPGRRGRSAGSAGRGSRLARRMLGANRAGAWRAPGQGQQGPAMDGHGVISPVRRLGRQFTSRVGRSQARTSLREGCGRPGPGSTRFRRFPLARRRRAPPFWAALAAKGATRSAMWPISVSRSPSERRRLRGRRGRPGAAAWRREAELGRLLQPRLGLRDLADLARQADLAEIDHARDRSAGRSRPRPARRPPRGRRPAR